MDKIKNTMTPSTDKEAEQLECSCTDGGNSKWLNQSGNQFVSFLESQTYNS
jgi:hypothetical protein